MWARTTDWDAAVRRAGESFGGDAQEDHLSFEPASPNSSLYHFNLNLHNILFERYNQNYYMRASISYPARGHRALEDVDSP